MNYVVGTFNIIVLDILCMYLFKVSFRPKYFEIADSTIPPSPPSRNKSVMCDEIYLSMTPNHILQSPESYMECTVYVHQTTVN